MEININEPKNINELEIMLKEKQIIVEDIPIIIEGNIFSLDGKWLLKSKKINSNDEEAKKESFYKKLEKSDRKIKEELQEKILENVPGGINVIAKKMLYAKIETQETSQKPYVLLSYIAILENVEQFEIEQPKKSEWNLYLLNQVKREELTQTTNYTYGKIKEEWKQIQNILDSYKKFDQQNFEKYFFYGMENRETLLEGIIYYTNMDLTKRYLEIKEKENLPPLSKQLENLEKRAIINYEQLYRFLNLVEKEESNFSIKLSDEQKMLIQKKVISKIKELISNNMFMFFKRGIFYDDRFHSNDPKSAERVKKIERI